jgi:hypothetical protein
MPNSPATSAAFRAYFAACEAGLSIAERQALLDAWRAAAEADRAAGCPPALAPAELAHLRDHLANELDQLAITLDRLRRILREL